MSMITQQGWIVLLVLACSIGVHKLIKWNQLTKYEKILFAAGTPCGLYTLLFMLFELFYPQLVSSSVQKINGYIMNFMLIMLSTVFLIMGVWGINDGQVSLEKKAELKKAMAALGISLLVFLIYLIT